MQQLSPLEILVKTRKNGKYQDQAIHLEIRFDDAGREVIFMKKPTMADFAPAHVFLTITGFISLMVLGIGDFPDIRLTKKEWIDTLLVLGSRENLVHWLEVFKIERS